MKYFSFGSLAASEALFKQVKHRKFEISCTIFQILTA
jgi:hypothetical protein